jgi:galactonate dehydratase
LGNKDAIKFCRIKLKVMKGSRRSFIKKSIVGTSIGAFIHGWANANTTPNALSSHDTLSIIDIHVHIVKVNHRGNWIFVELLTNKGISGIGEGSHGASGTTTESKDLLYKYVNTFFSFVKNESPFLIEQYRQRAWIHAREGRNAATVFSAIEQALWDIQGKALGVPVHQLLGGKLMDKIRTYANINRATNEYDSSGRRTAAAFQRSAAIALQQGFTAIKMAPFDEMKKLPSTSSQIHADIDHAIACLEAVRKTIGTEVDLMVDVHSHLDEKLGIEVAKRVEPLNLYWFEEPVNPQKFVLETKAITNSTERTTAGGESIFGREGFTPLIQHKALDILMPDVKHCGGMLELKYIAAMAETAGLHVAPHNPSGPVATASSVHAVATIPNFKILEMAHGEVPWRSSLIQPEEQFENGFITVSNNPGIGITLNKKELSKRT